MVQSSRRYIYPRRATSVQTRIVGEHIFQAGTDKKVSLKSPALKLEPLQGREQEGMTEEDWPVWWALGKEFLQILPLDKGWHPHAQTYSTHGDPVPEHGCPGKGVRQCKP